MLVRLLSLLISCAFMMSSIGFAATPSAQDLAEMQKASSTPYAMVIHPGDKTLTISFLDLRDKSLTRSYVLQKSQLAALKPYLYDGAAGLEVVTGVLTLFTGVPAVVGTLAAGGAASVGEVVIVMSATPLAAMSFAIVNTMPMDTFNPWGLYQRGENEKVLQKVSSTKSVTMVRFSREKALERFEDQVANFAGQPLHPMQPTQ